MSVVDNFLEFLIYKRIGKIRVANEKEYFEISKLIKEKTGKSISIKIVDNKNYQAYSPPFSSSIYITKGLEEILTFEEKIAVIFHEVGHIYSPYRYLYVIPPLSILMVFIGLILFSFPSHLIYTIILC
jgi:hypothetical protein